jgi:hypothetical protein
VINTAVQIDKLSTSSLGIKMSEDLRAKVLSGAQNAINAWIHRRKETVQAIEDLADAFQGISRNTDGTIKENLSTWLLRLPVILRIRGLATSLAVGTGLFKDRRFSKALEEVHEVFNREIDAYEKVVEHLVKLQDRVETVNMANSGNFMATYITLGAVIGRITVIIKESTSPALKSVGEHSLHATAERAAKREAISAFLLGFNQDTSEFIAKEAGEAAAKAVAKEITKGTKSPAALEKAATSAARQATSAIIKRVIESSRVPPGRSAYKRLTGAAIPLSVSVLENHKNVTTGQVEERELSQKIMELKEEANKIIINIGVMKLALPFPGIRAKL